MKCYLAKGYVTLYQWYTKYGMIPLQIFNCPKWMKEYFNLMNLNETPEMF